MGGCVWVRENKSEAPADELEAALGSKRRQPLGPRERVRSVSRLDITPAMYLGIDDVVGRDAQSSGGP
ncbi:hypothetical protein GGTG_10773 [Gaeumannomyces tritici R3-111a-1]|uniref:Uncharacterized protein n=1 Tax=Gaeumannomyces tritici (strain R3-111a-1) TaxID=644352 RepID=J3PBA0_GAET3|nr:hypothetical protein GGTG_10773 [Gaeumannomyces tritici R3-111a-1]EJT71516.1 hypothetical protein GGTG_10773 [Gaeumannomyces tritici R3-111a-1]